MVLYLRRDRPVPYPALLSVAPSHQAFEVTELVHKEYKVGLSLSLNDDPSAQRQNTVGHAAYHADLSKKYITLYLCFDDLRDGRAAFENISIASNDHRAVDLVPQEGRWRSRSAAETSRHDGQVSFVSFDLAILDTVQ